ncbi:hypothetical protein [Desulfosporosinus fructosivorans]
MLSPVFGVAYTEVCWAAYVKASRLCHTASRAWVVERGTVRLALECLGDGTFHVHRLAPLDIRDLVRDAIGGDILAASPSHELFDGSICQ